MREQQPLACRKLPLGSGLLALALLTYANWSAWRFRGRVLRAVQEGSPAEESPLEGLNFGHLGMLTLCVGWAVTERLTPAELGLGKQHLRTSSAWGLLIGGIGSLLAHASLAHPWVRNRLSVPPEWGAIPPARLLRFFVGPMLIGSALFEEFAFRALLQTKLSQSLGNRRGILVGSGAFAASHAVIAWFNLSRCGFSRLGLTVAYAAMLGTLFAIGLTLGILRRSTQHIAGSVLVHWMVLIGIGLGLQRMRERENRSRSGFLPLSAKDIRTTPSTGYR